MTALGRPPRTAAREPPARPSPDRRRAGWARRAPGTARPFAGRRPAELAARLAAALDGEVVTTPRGTVVRARRRRGRPAPRSRAPRAPARSTAGGRAAALPRHGDDRPRDGGRDPRVPGRARLVGGPAVPAGPAAAAGPPRRAARCSMRWPRYPAGRLAGDVQRPRLRLAAAGRALPDGRPRAPPHAGHLDLLPPSAASSGIAWPTRVCGPPREALLGFARHGDVGAGRSRASTSTFLRGGPPDPLVAVVRHNESDVRSLARLVAHLEQRYADRGRSGGGAAWRPRRACPRLCPRPARPRGARLPRRCARRGAAGARPVRSIAGAAGRRHEHPCRSRCPRRAAVVVAARSRRHFGGRGPAPGMPLATRDLAGVRWTDERLAAERARVLRRLGRHAEAAEAWRAAAATGGSLGAIAWIEVAKLREHRLSDVPGALEATRAGWQACERSRLQGRPLPRLEQDLVRRGRRLRARLDRRRAACRVTVSRWAPRVPRDRRRQVAPPGGPRSSRHRATGPRTRRTSTTRRGTPNWCSRKTLSIYEIDGRPNGSGRRVPARVRAAGPADRSARGGPGRERRAGPARVARSRDGGRPDTTCTTSR